MWISSPFLFTFREISSCAELSAMEERAALSTEGRELGLERKNSNITMEESEDCLMDVKLEYMSRGVAENYDKQYSLTKVEKLGKWIVSEWPTSRRC
jgi:hypothetical protein